MTVDIFCLIFRIYDRLIFIQSVITGNSIADGNCDQIIGNTTESEEFKCDQDRGDRAVGNTAEKCCHSGGRADRRGKSYQMPHETSESCADAERRNNLTTAESGTHGQRGQKNFPEEIQWTRLSLFNGKLDQIVACAHVISSS